MLIIIWKYPYFITIITAIGKKLSVFLTKQSIPAIMWIVTEERVLTQFLRQRRTRCPQSRLGTSLSGYQSRKSGRNREWGKNIRKRRWFARKRIWPQTIDAGDWEPLVLSLQFAHRYIPESPSNRQIREDIGCTEWTNHLFCSEMSFAHREPVELGYTSQLRQMTREEIFDNYIGQRAYLFKTGTPALYRAQTICLHLHVSTSRLIVTK